MADEEKQEGQTTSDENAESKPKKNKGPIKLIGALVGVVGLGAALAVMAIPSGPKEVPKFTGPYFHQLFAKQKTSNTVDNDYKRYIKANPQVEFFAYDANYMLNRDLDPLYQAWLDDTFGNLMAGKSLEEIFDSSARERFAQEIRHAVEPVLFPVHIGETGSPLEADPASGLRPGDSYRQNTFSGAFWEHTLKVDGTAKTLSIDGGPEVTFQGNELDLKVTAPSGEYIYVDVTSVDPKFAGDVPLGVHGRIRQVFIKDYLAQ